MWSARCAGVCVLFVVFLGVYAQEPIALSTIEDVQKIGSESGYPIDGHYILTQNIDASATALWNNGRGFVPIGDWTTGFSGNLDGQGFFISNLHMHPDPYQAFYCGLFAIVSEGSRIERLGLVDCTISGNYRVGAIAGMNKGLVSQCYMTGAVAVTSIYGTGGRMGGLVGENAGSGKIVACHATGEMRGEDIYEYGHQGGVGGIAGYNAGAVDQCRATVNVVGQNRAGGLVGIHMLEDGWVSDGEPGSPGTITKSHAEGTVNGSDNVLWDEWHQYCLGGLVGQSGERGASGQPHISDCYSTAAVTGFEGWGTLSQYVGGLAGQNWGFVSRCYATGDVSGGGDVGGLIGESDSPSELYQCRASGAVTAGAGGGGLVGSSNGGQFVQCFATGDVNVEGNGGGGFAGLMSKGVIKQCYAAGDVAAHTDIAGFAGYFYGQSLEECYAVGRVMEAIPPPGWGSRGGFTTVYSMPATSCFWDVETSGMTLSGDGCVGLPTAAMQQKSTYKDAGWDFAMVWGMGEESSYPCLRWASPVCVGDPPVSVSIAGSTEIRRKIGQNQVFTAVVSDAFGDISYQWYFDNGDKSVLPIDGATESVHEILHLSAQHEGWYSCEVTDAHFSAMSSPVHLLVYEELSLSGKGIVAVMLLVLILGFCSIKKPQIG